MHDLFCCLAEQALQLRTSLLQHDSGIHAMPPRVMTCKHPAEHSGLREEAGPLRSRVASAGPSPEPPGCGESLGPPAEQPHPHRKATRRALAMNKGKLARKGKGQWRKEQGTHPHSALCPLKQPGTCREVTLSWENSDQPVCCVQTPQEKESEVG